MTTLATRYLIQKDIAPFLNGSDLVTLIALHHDFRLYLASFVDTLHKMIQIETPKEQLQFAAEIGSRELCELMRPLCLQSLSRKPNLNALPLDFQPVSWNWMLRGALKCRDLIRARQLCILAHAWGAVSWAEMVSVAATKGNKELCKLACSWWDVQYQVMLNSATCGSTSNHIEICNIAIVRGLKAGQQMDLELMLYYAIQNNQPKICELARHWSITLRKNPPIDAYTLLINAASQGRRELCILARTWSATLPDQRPLNFNKMYLEAKIAEQPEICELARSWGASL